MSRHIAEKNLSELLEKTIYCNGCMGASMNDCATCDRQVTKEDRKKKFRTIMGKALTWTDILRLEAEMENYGFFDAPASVKHHGNYDGGLFDHSLCVTECLVNLTEKLGLEWRDKRSPYIVGMFHDLCKVRNYEKKEDGSWGYVNEHVLPGHGEKSVIMLQFLKHLTEEEMLCIRWHMGAFDDSKNWQYFTNAVNRYPNVLWTHAADMEAAHIIEV